MTELPKLLHKMISLLQEKKGSDIHLLEGEKPRLRLQGDLRAIEIKDHPQIQRQDIEAVLDTALSPKQREIFEQTSDVDFSLVLEKGSGRVNVGRANGRRLHLTMRYLPSEVIPLDHLGIDLDMLKALAKKEDGMVIVAGETSSGKTTTIAAMLDYINHTQYGAITTIENPVEYILPSDRCLITQREIGRDTPDFQAALRAAVRKNPDVLLIGEIRDYETATIALNAAETGILIFCTIHATGALSAITRLANISVTEDHDEEEFYLRLSIVLRGVISQQLVKSADGSRYLPAYEILNIVFSEKTYIRERDFKHLESSLESERNISLGRCLYKLWHSEPRLINADTIKRFYSDQFNLVMNRLEDPAGYKPLVSGMG